MVGASVTATARLKKDYAKLLKEPVPFMKAHPLHSNILEWHYIIMGAPSTPYEGGIYHGKLVFPADFPFKPPSIYMLTPSGRFQTNTRLCLSISDFHPDTWNPAWTVSTIITGLLSFMNDNQPTLGSLTTSDAEKKLLAKKSKSFNLKNRIFCELFSDVAEEIRTELKSAQEEESLKEEEERIRQQKSQEKEDDNNDKQEGRVIQNRQSEGLSSGGAGLSSLMSNLIVIAGVVALAFAVRWVVLSAQDQDPSFRP